jgi:hypothetical protein
MVPVAFTDEPGASATTMLPTARLPCLIYAL